MSMNQSRMWTYFQNERVDLFTHSLPRLRYLMKRAKKIVDSRPPVVLNIGVGSGLLEDLLTREGWKVRGLDPCVGPIERLRRTGIEVDVGTIEALPYKKDTFDIVFCSEILEHLSADQMETGLREVFRVLKPGGHLIGTVPAQENLKENEVVCPNCGQIFHRWGHHQDFDQAKLRNIFSGGMRTITVKSRLFISWQGVNLKRKIAAFMKLMLFYIGSHGSNETLYFEVTK